MMYLYFYMDDGYVVLLMLLLLLLYHEMLFMDDKWVVSLFIFGVFMTGNVISEIVICPKQGYDI